MKTVLIRHERPDWTDWYVEQFSELFPDFEFRPAYTLDDAMRHAPDTNAIIGIGPQMPPQLISSMKNLEWVQSLTTGIDNLLAMQEMPKNVPITKCARLHGTQMTELALLFMLNLVRDFPNMLDNQKAAVWDRQPQPLLYEKTVCLLGLGSIAETIANVCSVLGMTVTGVSNGRSTAPHVDRVYPRARLEEAASEADFLIVLVPLSDETRNIIDARILAAMKPSAFLINMARGGCVDEAALIEALQKGEIAGAGLDVFEREPLPPDDPVWQAPNVILTPHVGGFADIYHKQCFPIVLENLRAYASGGPEALKSAARR